MAQAQPREALSRFAAGSRLEMRVAELVSRALGAAWGAAAVRIIANDLL
jgi:hypothetical protein